MKPISFPCSVKLLPLSQVPQDKKQNNSPNQQPLTNYLLYQLLEHYQTFLGQTVQQFLNSISSIWTFVQNTFYPRLEQLQHFPLAGTVQSLCHTHCVATRPAGVTARGSHADETWHSSIRKHKCPLSLCIIQAYAQGLQFLLHKVPSVGSDIPDSQPVFFMHLRCSHLAK